MDKLKKGMLVLLVGIAMIGFTASSVSAINKPSPCVGECDALGYQGCKNNDPLVDENKYFSDENAVHTYLESKGYHETAWYVRYPSRIYDMTRNLPDNYRYQGWDCSGGHKACTEGPEPNPESLSWDIILWHIFYC